VRLICNSLDDPVERGRCVPSTPTPTSEFVLHDLVPPTSAAIVHTVSGYPGRTRLRTIIENRQYGDRRSGRFFMRVHFTTTDHSTTVEELRIAFRADRPGVGDGVGTARTRGCGRGC